MAPWVNIFVTNKILFSVSVCLKSATRKNGTLLLDSWVAKGGKIEIYWKPISNEKVMGRIRAVNIIFCVSNFVLRRLESKLFLKSFVASSFLKMNIFRTFLSVNRVWVKYTPVYFLLNYFVQIMTKVYMVGLDA